MKIVDIFEKYIEYQRLKLKESTVSAYYQTAYKHIFPICNIVDWQDLTIYDINDFLYLQKNTYKLSEKSMYGIKVLFNSLLKYSYQNGYIKQYICIPNKKPKSKNVIVFNDEECKRLESYLLNNISFVNLGILLALLSGFRLGEVCALTWNEIDIENQVIHITKTVERIKNLDKNTTTKTKLIVDTPKSETSARDVPIPSFILPLLKKMKALDNWYILTASQKFMEPRLLQKKYQEILKNASVDYKNFHTLRHTFATNALHDGMDIKTLSELLGHENAAFTLRVYVHSSMELKREEINSIYANRCITA